MHSKASFSWLFLPIIVLTLIASMIFIERTGMNYNTTPTTMQFLPPVEENENRAVNDQPTDCLVLYDSISDVDLKQLSIATDTLDSMRVHYAVQDINHESVITFDDHQAIIITFFNLDKISEEILNLENWVEEGGKVLFTIRPEIDSAFTAIYRKLGIMTYGYQTTSIASVEFTSTLFPGMKGRTLVTGFDGDSSLALALEDDATLHMVSGGRDSTPILWEYTHGDGHFVVINSDQFLNKHQRGIICAAYSLLFDTIIYPVINSSMVFIDDFPGPIPEGSDENIFKEFGRDIESFYVNIWWEDMKDFARRYGLKYTGLLIETYNDKITPPFIEEKTIAHYEYFGASLLDNGGEIGLHGYNHIPLATWEDGDNPDLGYPLWENDEYMQLSIDELYTFGISLFPEEIYTSYVPPSNILGVSARSWLPARIPELKVIASYYMEDPDTNGFYTQEFKEAHDGIIEVPRVISGYEVTPYAYWSSISEIMLHYVNSHFIHPDDVLDVERGGDKGWGYLRNTFEEYLMWLQSGAPDIRQMTASEGGMAVQRFARLDQETDCSKSGCSMQITDFYDDAWFLMRTSHTPENIENGSITKIADNLYLIKADNAQVEIAFEE